MDLRSLEIFLAVLEFGSIQAASESVGLSQPAVTKRIKALEDELQATLLKRQSRGVVPTEIGITVSEYARRISVSTTDLSNAVRAIREGRTGTLRIGVGKVWHTEAFARTLTRLQNDFPEMEVQLVSGRRSDLIDELRRGKLDVLATVDYDLGPYSDLKQIDVDEAPFRIICRENHPLMQVQRPKLKDLLTERWLLPPRIYQIRSFLDALFGSKRLPSPEPSVIIDSTVMLFQMLRLEDYISVVDERRIQTGSAIGICALDITLDIPKVKTSLVILKEKPITPQMSAFFEALEVKTAFT